MKLRLILGAFACMFVSAQGAVTLTLSNGTSGALSNFATGAGTSSDVSNVTNRMVWGILVDSSGNGFTAGGYNSGFSLAANNTGIALSDKSSVLTDDVLYIASAVMASSSTAIDAPAPGEVAANQNRLLSFTSLNYNVGLGVTAGDKIAIIWFDTTTLGGTAPNGMKYGVFQLPHTTDGTEFVDVLPTDNGGSYVFAPAFAGSDSLKTMAFTAGVPEPSAALLGAIGVLGLLRRRRN